MSISSDSGDGADIFWPGYVDAITNLAINLLFVIAVMSIIVLATTLELLKKPKIIDPVIDDRTPRSIQVQGPVSGGSASPKTGEKEMAIALKEAERRIVELTKAAAKSAATNSAASHAERQEIVTASKPATSDSQDSGETVIRAVTGGLVIVFQPGAQQLTSEEEVDAARKLATFGSISDSRWQITIVTPKEFSITKRAAFYRVNIVRSLLLKNGAKGENIDTQIIESDSPSANNARVTVQRMGG